MAENDGGAKFGYFLAGLGIGALIGILFAPRSGEETREYLRERGEAGVDFMKRQAAELQERAERLRERAAELAEKGKEYAARQRETVTAAIDAGKTAYREEKRKM